MTVFQLGQWVIVKALVSAEYDMDRFGARRSDDMPIHEPPAKGLFRYSARKCLYRDTIRASRYLVVGRTRIATGWYVEARDNDEETTLVVDEYHEVYKLVNDLSWQKPKMALAEDMEVSA